MKKFCILSIAILAIVITNACNSEEEENYNLMPEEFQGDNYYSNVSVEYEVNTTIPVAMTADEYADETVRNDIVTRRITAFGFYLTIYLFNKLSYFPNYTYGGFRAMTRNLSYDDILITGDATNGYFITFTMDIAGPPNLLTAIPRAEGTESSSTFMFDLQMPKGATIDPDNIPTDELKTFDPAKYTGELETARCEVNGLPAIGNAYPHFDDFIADGVYDITIFSGYDYHTQRYDLSISKTLFQRLIALGFSLPYGVQKYEDLTYQSGPLKKNYVFYNGGTANFKSFSINVRLFNSDMFTNNRQTQHDIALQEMVERDVFFYIGHAGPYHTFYLDPAHEADITLEEFENAPFTDKQQLFILNGCMTYSQYADLIYSNSVKNEDNLDVITTVNYDPISANPPLNMLNNIIKFDSLPYFIPVDYYTLITNVNNSDNDLNKYMTFYGVVGIDGNPQLHPYADITKTGVECHGTQSICGNPEGNLCAIYPDEVKRCVVRTLSKTGCPEGTTFYVLQNQTGPAGTGVCGQ